MANNGRDYENFVLRLQQALINSEQYLNQKNISIQNNVKITDNFGIEREFDLYWEYELAGITYKTVIECKDYNSKIPLEKVDALIGKIKDIPDLKAIFATKTGYQSGAEKKALHNKIDLLIVREQIDDDWKDKDGNPLIKEIHINLLAQFPAQIKEFIPKINKDWAEKNTTLDLSKPLEMVALNTAIFIEDKEKNERYSVYDLQHKLSNTQNKDYGEFTQIIEFNNAYITYNSTILKLDAYKVVYTVPKPHSMPIIIDYAKELIGIIEYVSKNSTVAIFKDRIIKNWNK